MANGNQFPRRNAPGQQRQQQNQEGAEEREPGQRPDYRLMQSDKDKDGKSVLISVGGMWKATSEKGEEYFNVRIGRLKLLAFKNNPLPPQQQ